MFSIIYKVLLTLSNTERACKRIFRDISMTLWDCKFADPPTQGTGYLGEGMPTSSGRGIRWLYEVAARRENEKRVTGE